GELLLQHEAEGGRDRAQPLLTDTERTPEDGRRAVEQIGAVLEVVHPYRGAHREGRRRLEHPRRGERAGETTAAPPALRHGGERRVRVRSLPGALHLTVLLIGVIETRDGAHIELGDRAPPGGETPIHPFDVLRRSDLEQLTRKECAPTAAGGIAAEQTARENAGAVVVARQAQVAREVARVDREIRAVAAQQLSASPQVGTLLIIGVQHVGAQTTRSCEPGLLAAGQPVYAAESVPLSRNRVSPR